MSTKTDLRRVIEMQAIAALLIEDFEFSLPPSDTITIKRKPMTIMAPMADGYPGVWLGLKVKTSAKTHGHFVTSDLKFACL